MTQAALPTREPGEVEWDRGWLGRHCKASGRSACRMIGGTGSSSAAGEILGNAPRVANRHHFPGRKLPARGVYVGRGSALGNPYTLKDHGLEALELYRRWPWGKLKARDPAVVGALSRVTPLSLLVCSCWPAPCHADVIRLAWGWMRDEGLLDEDAAR